MALRPKLVPFFVVFRGVQLQIPRPSVDQSLLLAGGGFREGSTVKFRFPATVQPVPAAKEPIFVVESGKTLYVHTCTTGGAGLAQEHIVEAATA